MLGDTESNLHGWGYVVASLAAGISREENAQALIDLSIAYFDSVDILVNNASSGVIRPFNGAYAGDVTKDDRS
jgi:NAD(P)-dependent dehydrogenase (short-subunit alcohol dehydrogenase family)